MAKPVTARGVVAGAGLLLRDSSAVVALSSADSVGPTGTRVIVRPSGPICLRVSLPEGFRCSTTSTWKSLSLIEAGAGD